MKPRALALDALRGYAIITMILSGQMVLTHLPNWMAHAQVPPNMGFDPSIYGITWVDLVFPFFLFAMGAAFPFSIGRQIQQGTSKLRLSLLAGWRGIQLVYFAIFFQHMKPFVISAQGSWQSAVISLFAFALLFFMFADLKNLFFTKTEFSIWIRNGVKCIAFALGFVLMYSLQYTGKKTPDFDVQFSDIIIIVLANMAVFGACAYIFTYNKPLARIALLPFVMALFLSSTNEGWVNHLFSYSPLPWAYKFYYLKYLFIVIPGSLAGEYLYTWLASASVPSTAKPSSAQAASLAVLALALIVSNITFLYTRNLFINVILSLCLLLAMYKILHVAKGSYADFWFNLFRAGSYLLLLGLSFEAFEGGIRKDPSTYSYYFVSSGLAFLALLFLSVVCDYFACNRSTRFMIMSGQNPMIAYVATALVIMPVFALTHSNEWLVVFQHGAWMGFLQGVLITSLAVLITLFFTKIKWFWRT
ncbi:MAG: hypothetical protein RL662_2394 [Bacteroidota bacterium]|jgi:predicted acyltransferase